MAFRTTSHPPGFAWLRATYRPSADEVSAYAQFIATAEGDPGRAGDSRLRNEAELQLWIWRDETRARPQRGRRRQEPTALAARD